MGVSAISGTCARPVGQNDQRYDLASVSAAEIAAMVCSKDQRTRVLGMVLRGAQLTYAPDMKAGVKISVTTSCGNGGYPVLTYIPKGYDPNKPTTVQTHYHGHSATVFSGSTHGAGQLVRIRAVTAKNPQTVFVLPETADVPSGKDWCGVSSQAVTTSDALAGTGVKNVNYRIVSAHSGGGRALANAMQSDIKGNARGVEADRLECLDCFYDCEKTIAPWASTKAGRRVANVVYVHATNTQTDSGVAAAFSGRYDRFESGGHDRASAAYLNTMDRALPSVYNRILGRPLAWL